MLCGAPEGIRTPDPRLRRALLYPAELPAQKNGAGDGNRTHAASLEGWNSTIELHPHAIYTTPKNNSIIEEKSQRFLRYIATIFVRSFPDSTKAQQYAR